MLRSSLNTHTPTCPKNVLRLVLALDMGVEHLAWGVRTARPNSEFPEQLGSAFTGRSELILSGKRRGWRGILGLINTEV